MISREPTLARLATAHDTLLAPHGLTETHLRRALGDMLATGVDDADLYFQYTRAEGWSLEEGIVRKHVPGSRPWTLDPCYWNKQG